MAKAADMIAQKIMKGDPNTAPNTLYGEVSKQIKEKFPDRFEEKPQAKTSKVSTSSNRGTKTAVNKQVRLSDLPEEERRIVKNMMEMTGKTEEEYLKNYEL